MAELSKSQINNVKKYIKKQWKVLTRDHKELAKTSVDHKITETAAEKNKHIIYISAKESLNRVNTQLKNELSADDFSMISVKKLPSIMTYDSHNFITKYPGLLYLPNPYVAPGGRFNEMYGWDSYFILLGLLYDDQLEMAKWMTENLLYEVKYYGKILNANRSYYLTRSQPPLLSSMVLAIYDKTKDKKWLKTTVSANTKVYQYWTQTPRLVKSIGLSRFYAESNTPIPETEHGYYDAVRNFYRENNIKAYDVAKFYHKRTDKLTAEFYRADRTVREAGFDLTNKYGPFGADITSYISVSLNTLLYKLETDMVRIHKTLSESKKAETWQARATRRARLINQYLWEPDLGFYFDYNHRKQYNRTYIYATTFYPLWGGIASKKQVARIIENLEVLDAKGGIISSAYVTGMQWDAPFGWAPHQYFAVHGLERYGYHKEACEIAKKFVTMLTKDFAKTKKLYEKYNMRTTSSDVTANIKYGYKINVEGFGWTNAIYLDFLNYLDKH